MEPRLVGVAFEMVSSAVAKLAAMAAAIAFSAEVVELSSGTVIMEENMLLV